MRVLIVSTPRSGSTVLSRAIGNALKSKQYHEPFNFDYPSVDSKDFPFQIQNDSLVRTMIGQKSIEFYDGFARGFNKVILLSRKDIHSMYESFLYRVVHHPKGSWHTEYVYKDTDDDLDIKNYLIENQKKLQEFSSLIDVPMSWYEDIYSGDKEIVQSVIDTWELGLTYDDLEKFINPKYRYRKFKKDTLI